MFVWVCSHCTSCRIRSPKLVLGWTSIYSLKKRIEACAHLEKTPCNKADLNFKILNPRPLQCNPISLPLSSFFLFLIFSPLFFLFLLIYHIFSYISSLSLFVFSSHIFIKCWIGKNLGGGERVCVCVAHFLSLATTHFSPLSDFLS